MSDTDVSIRAVVPCAPAGRIITMGFPGLGLAANGDAHIDPDALAATLDDPRMAGCQAVIALAETAELPDGALALLATALAGRGVAWAHFPIVDYAAPSAGFETEWRAASARYHQILDAGGAVAITCHYGAGRSGTIAARLLTERGAAPAAAIAAVRAAFPESIESEVQVRWIHAPSAPAQSNVQLRRFGEASQRCDKTKG